MALFCINRYLGDDEPTNNLNDKSRSQILLQKLHQEAKVRQQQLGIKTGTTNEQKGENKESEGVQDRKGKRKAKEEAGISEEGRKKTKQLARGNKERGRKPKSKQGGDAGLGTENLFQEIVKISGDEAERKDETTDDKASPLDVSGELIKSQEKGNEDLGKADQLELKEESAHNENQTSAASTSTFAILGGFKKKKVEKVQRVLPQWLSKPTLVNKDIKQNLIAVDAVPGIHPTLIQKLQANGIHSFFPVQAELIPALLESSRHGLILGRGGYRPSDICVSAPTGSGKTLAFVIPIIQALMDCSVCRVRALALLPTKELAQQVFKIFNTYVEGMDLRVVIVAGQKTFAMEQSSLVEHSIVGYRSLADIVISTPGRLVDHINKTEGFSLQHLRYLIIDEADRMIDSMHHNWLNQVVKAVYKVDGHSAADALFQRVEPGVCTAVSHSRLQMPLQKLLFSATLTKDSEKLQRLVLHQPRLFTANYTSQEQESTVTRGEQQPSTSSVENKYALPEGLTEFYVPCQLNKKPLIILYFALIMKFGRILCFTNSRDASHRLFLLLHAFGGIHVAEFSSRLSPNERRKTLKQFEQGKLQILISTDATARGIDVSNVTCVINYDAPHFIRTYIHRIGRTARGGNSGLAFTLLLKVQEEQFLQMLSDAGSTMLKKQLVKPEYLRALTPRYEEALQELRQIVKDEKKKSLS
ncbi:ATP-dependent RNA helicase DDX51 isoform X1 [Amblyraja radiata]|uniref:ATP-dependent RNA helicase DDX51 isoform X1 n=1 Tax=Amblyraja radiata TaxID=386614 RepID=UPI00140239A6|nr:ATP-dependent RNA helicase DDX51 isoform X1 [Amblyraja radiata]